MAYSTVRTISYRKRGYGGYRAYRSRALVNRAAQLLRRRMGRNTRAPLATRGWYGSSFRSFNGRGRPELKFVDTDTPAFAVPASGVVTLMNGVIQGTGVSNRIGRKFTMKSILHRGAYYPSSTVSSPVGTIVRCLCVYDAQTNSPAAAPAVTDILATAAWDSPMNLNNRERFKVIFDFVIAIGSTTFTAGALTAGSPMPRTKQIYKKMNMDVINSNITGTVDAIATGALFLVEIANINSTVNSDWFTRIRFSDD